MLLEAASAARDPIITDWLTSFGTIGAVVAALVIAIWGDWLRGLFAKPRLTVSIAMKPPDAHKIEVTNIREAGIAIGSTYFTQAYWFRLSVGNEGRVGARNVEVRLLSLAVQLADGNFQNDSDFIPLGLIWSHSDPGSTVAERIPRKLSRHCDFCHVHESRNDPPLIEFDTEITPNQVRPGVWPTRKPVGTYRCRLVVTADNADPRYRDFEIRFAGWLDDEDAMFTEGVVITPL